MAQTGVTRVRSIGRVQDLRNLIYVGFFFIVVAAYLALVFFAAPNPSTLSHYHLSVAHYHWLIAPIILFLVLIWSAGLYGSLKVKSYAGLIGSSQDGKAFNLMAIGFLVLSLSIPFLSVFQSLSAIFSHRHPGATPTLTITSNYLNLLSMCVALWLIAIGAEKLSALDRSRLRAWSKDTWVFLFIVLSSLYGYFLIGQSRAASVFYMPRWLILITLAVPYLFFWYKGLRGAQEIYQYQKKVRGQLYKSSLKYLAIGISLVIASSIITRSLATISLHINRLQLTPILLIIYGLLIIMAGGYLMIALGAQKLKQLEEV